MRMVRTSVVGSVLYIAAALIAHAAPQPVESKITAVTVYAGRALVTRTASVHVEPGQYELVFEQLPGSLEENSVGVSGRGTAAVEILRLSVQRQFLGQPQDERIRGLEDQVQELRDRDKSLQDQQSVASSKIVFLDKIEIFSVEKMGKDIAVGEIKPDSWSALLEFAGKTREQALTAIQQIEIQRRALAREIKVKDDELAQLRGFRPTQARSVNVVLDVKAVGDVTLDLRYLVPGATWEPLYDLRCDRDKGAVEVVYYGKVRQNTGEDWKDVSLSLSTAKPTVGANLPELQPWYIVTAPPEKRERTGAKAALAAGAAMESQAVRLGEIAKEEVRWGGAAAQETGLSVVFTAQGKETVPSTNEERRSTIDTVSLKADFTYVTVPKLKSYAFLKAEMKNTTGLPLLAGAANVFHGLDYVGESALKTILPNESFNVFVGADEFVKVNREMLVDKVKYSFWGKSAKSINAFRITVENQRPSEVKVVVRDQIPVSRTSEIQVDDFDATPKPAVPPSEENQGMVEWQLTLKPGEKATIDFEFSITYPRGMQKQLSDLNYDGGLRF